MKNFISTSILLFSFSVFSFSQIEFKLERLQNDTGWGVYAKHNGNVHPPSNNVDLGSAQVTIVASTGFEFTNLKNINGIWSQNSRVNAPIENPTVDYIDVGYLSSFPNDGLFEGKEILMFTFETIGDCPDKLYLMGEDDPFHAPNSTGNHPGANFDVIEKGYLPRLYLYSWTGNYQDCPDVCEWCVQSLSSTDEKISSEIHIYPNPSNGDFTISIDETDNGNMEFQIINQLGQIIDNQTIASNKTEINLDLANGIYTLFIKKENQLISTERVIIQK